MATDQIDKTPEKHSDKTGQKPADNPSSNPSASDQRDSAQKEKTRVEQTSGKQLSAVEVKNEDGSKVTTNEKNQVTKVVNAKGETTEFGYGPDGKINSIKDKNGTWTSQDGIHWKNDKGETATHAVTVNKYGAILRRDNNSETISQPDGKTITHSADGATKVTDDHGHITELVDAKGHKTEFGYGADGKLNQITDQDGTQWKSSDGNSWTGSNGKTRTGPATLDQDGTFRYQDEKGNQVIAQPSGLKETREANGRVTQELDGKTQETHKQADANELEKTADAIRENTGKDHWYWRSHPDAICDLLKDKNEAERKMIEDIYQRKYGISLDKEMDFMSAADKDRFTNILHKKDGDVVSQDSSRIHEALLQHDGFFSNSNPTADQDIRDSLSGKRADQIQKMDEEYRQKYGVSLRDAIMKNPDVSQSTKDMVDIYLKGNDKRTDEDTLKLAHIALDAKDSKMFEEVMHNASDSARKQFLDQGGEKQIKDAFGSDHGWGAALMGAIIPGYGIKVAMDERQSDKDVTHAMDLAKEGKVDAATQINDNAGMMHATTNDKGVEAAVNGMTDEERARYLAGKKLTNGDLDAGKEMTEEQKQQARDYYKKMHDAMTNAGNETHVQQWEDMIQHKGGSLVSKLAAHRGVLWNDSSGDIAKDIENMDKSDWERLHPGSPNYDPNYRKQIEDMLKSYTSDEDVLKRCHDLLDAKEKAATFEDSQKQGRSSVLDTLEDNKHWYKNDTHGMLEAISKMTPAEQEKYRTDADYRKKVDEAVKDAFADQADDGRPESLRAAQDMLAKVAKGEKLNYDIVANLEGYAADFKTDHAQAVRDIEQAFKDDPGLRDRINNPKTDEDRAYAEKFNSTARAALGDGDYDKYVSPLLKTGHLDIDTKLQMDKGFFKNDHDGALKDITSASPDELKKMREDPAYREKCIGFLSDEDKKIAEQVIQQGKVNPEDDLRQGIVHWFGSSDIMDKLRSLKDNPQELDRVKKDYAAKYGRDLEGDLLDKLGGDDKAEARRILHDHETAGEKYNDARDEYYRTRSGFGSEFVEKVGGSGTGYQLDETMANYRKEVSDANKNFQDFTPEKAKELEDRFQEALKNHKEAKAATADYVVDGVVAGAAIASLIVTGGADAPLLLAMAAGGAAMKVGAKAAMEGGDYDSSTYAIALDCCEGAVNGVTSVLGPGEAAAIFKVGETAALRAAEVTAKELGEQGVKTMLKEGGEEALEKGTADIMRHSLASGAKEIDKKAIADLAEKTVSRELTGEAREKAVQELTASLTKNLNQEFQQETANWLTNLGRETALNAAGGAMGGGASGTFQGFTEWDPKKSVEENLAMVAKAGSMSALSGGIMGGTMTLGMKGLGAGFTHAKSMFQKASEEAGAAAGASVGTKIISEIPPPAPPAPTHVDVPPPVPPPPAPVTIPVEAPPPPPPPLQGAPQELPPPPPQAQAGGGGGSNPVESTNPNPNPNANGNPNAGGNPSGQPSEASGPNNGSNGDGKAGQQQQPGQQQPGQQPGQSPEQQQEQEQQRQQPEAAGSGQGRKVAPEAGPGGPGSDRPFNYGKTVLYNDSMKVGPADVPLTGDKVIYGGEKFNVEGVDARNGYMVIDQQGGVPAPTRERVSQSEFRNNYQRIDMPGQKNSSDFYVRDSNGQVYKAYSDDQGIILDTVPGKRAVSHTQLSKPSINGPEDVTLKIGGKAVELNDGQLLIGRQFQTADGSPMTHDSGVSARHGKVTYDRNTDQYYYQDTYSTNGSYIKKAGSDTWTPVGKGGKVEIEPGDSIRLGSDDRNIMTIGKKAPKEFPNPDDVQIYVGDRPVQLKDGAVSVGRNERVDGSFMVDDGNVSRQHGTVRYDAKEGAFYYKDNSSKGTYIKRPGSNSFEKIAPGQEVRISTQDEIHLGAPNGPQLKLASLDAHVPPFSRAADVEISVDGNKTDLLNGPVRLGRGRTIGDSGNPVSDPRVSANHGELRWDNQQGGLVYTDHSSQGTYIKRQGSDQFEYVRGRETRVGANDEIRLGSPDGPQVKLSNANSNANIKDSQAFFDGRPLDLSSGKIEIGRNYQAFGNNKEDALNNLVSADHGTLSWNKQEGAFYYTDHSSNGTYIKRPGEEKFVKMPSNQPVKIGPYDKVRLGGEAGPELKLTQTKGDRLDNGRVLFRRENGAVIRNPDGSEIVNDGAGIRLEKNAQGKVVGATEQNGLERSYSYSSKGELMTARFGNGERWDRVGDDDWIISRANGSRDRFKGDIQVESDGSMRLKTGGKQPDTVYRLDGSTEVQYPNGRIEYTQANLPAERSRLNVLADHNFSNIEQKQRFDKIVNDFQARARAQGLSDNQVALTYHQINRLMLGGADAPLTLAERVRLSEQIMHETAYPELIDQGRNPTCNVATVEDRIFTRQPEKAAQLIADVATTGKYVTADGTMIDLSRVPGGLRPDAEALRAMQNPLDPAGWSDIKLDGKRTWAGQIFEQTAANVKWARTPELHMQPGDVLMYTKSEGKAVNRLMKYSVGADGKLQITQVHDAPKIYTPELTDIHNQITGTNDSNFVIVGPGSDTGLPGQAVRVDNAQQFDRTLREMYQKKNFPAILLVDARNEPFAQWIGQDGSTEAWHVINIQNVHTDPRTGKLMVEFTNQWGEKANHMGAKAVPADQLFEATRPAGTRPQGLPRGQEAGGGGGAQTDETPPAWKAEPMAQPRDASTGDGSAPRGDGSAPRSDGSAPRSDGSAARSDGSAPRSDGSAPRGDGGTLDRPTEVAAPESLPRTEIKPTDHLDVQRIKAVSAEIAERFREKPMTQEQFQAMFSKMSPEDQKVAIEILEHSAPNMNSRALDAQLSALAKQMDAHGTVTVYTLSGDSSGNPLAYLFRKNNPNIKVNIKVLDPAALAELSEHGDGGQGLIFDDLSHATPEQRAFLAQQKDLTVADLGGFDKGMNLWDFGATKYAGPELMENKLAELTGQARELMAKDPNLSLEDAIQRVTNGDTAETVKGINPNAKIVKPEIQESGRELRAMAADSQQEVVDDLYREFTEPMISKQQIADFLGSMDARQQASAALILRDGVTVNNYSTMMEQMRSVQQKILAQTGARPEDLIIMHSFDNNGSAYLVDSLYAKVNGLDSSQFMSLDEVKAAAKGSLKGKVLVYLDDVSYSGKQSAENIINNGNALKQSGARVAVGTLGAYDVPADKNYWTIYERNTAIEYQQLKRLHPTVVSGAQYTPFYAANNPHGLANVFRNDPDLLLSTAGRADWSKSPVDAAIVLPYGGPNNNIELLNELLREMEMPGSGE